MTPDPISSNITRDNTLKGYTPGSEGSTGTLTYRDKIAPGGTDHLNGVSTVLLTTVTALTVPVITTEYTGDTRVTSLIIGNNHTKDLGSYRISAGDGSVIISVLSPGGFVNIIHGENIGASVSMRAHDLRATRTVVHPVAVALPPLTALATTGLTLSRTTGGTLPASHGTTLVTGARNAAENKADPIKSCNSTAVVATSARVSGSLSDMASPITGSVVTISLLSVAVLTVGTASNVAPFGKDHKPDMEDAVDVANPEKEAKLKEKK